MGIRFEREEEEEEKQRATTTKIKVSIHSQIQKNTLSSCRDRTEKLKFFQWFDDEETTTKKPNIFSTVRNCTSHKFGTLTTQKKNAFSVSRRI